MAHFDVTILAGIIGLLAIELLHLAISLPREITDLDVVVGDKPKPIKQAGEEITARTGSAAITPDS